MSLYRFSFEIELPEDMKPTTALGAMADAVLALGCYVGEEAQIQPLHPPLRLVHNNEARSSE
jgi:hypothetical protein